MLFGRYTRRGSPLNTKVPDRLGLKGQYQNLELDLIFNLEPMLLFQLGAFKKPCFGANVACRITEQTQVLQQITVVRKLSKKVQERRRRKRCPSDAKLSEKLV